MVVSASSVNSWNLYNWCCAWEATLYWKAELKCVFKECGAELLMTFGVDWMHKWSADNWDILMDVCTRNSQ